MINIIRILIALLVFTIIVDQAKAEEINQNAKTSVSHSDKDKLDKKSKIYNFIKLVQPKYTNSYISKIADSIMKYGNKYDVDPYLITSTAYVESEFSMRSRPCNGIMQLLKSTPKYYDPKKQYDPYTVDGNIAIGTIELSHHIHKNTNRGESPNRASTRYALKRYNGSHSQVSYAIKVMRVKFRLETLSLESLKKKLKSGPMWRE